jgi:sugar diacid utilization regulator
VTTDSSWLQLLLRNAPSAELREHLAHQLSAATSPREHALVEEAANSAFQLRDQIAELRQSAGELKALNQIAGRLAGLRDVDPLLQQIVTYVHDLLHVDLAYLGLVNDDDPTKMTLRNTAGALSPQLKGLVFDLDTGLGGRVVASGAPQWTTDYLIDAQILHGEVSDAAVSTERVRGLLGVPLQLAGEVIGVLFAGARHQRPFTEGQITLLTSLAAHAAIAIENARMFERTHRAVAELNNVNATLRSEREDVERAAGLHRRLTEIVIGGASVPEVVDVVATVTGHEVGYQPWPGAVSTPRPRPEPDPPDRESLAARFVSPDQRRTSVLRLTDGQHAVATPNTSGDQYLGCLVMSADAPPSELDVRHLEQGALVTALVLVTERAVTEAELRQRDEFVAELLIHPHRDAHGLARRAQRLSFDLGTPHHVVVLAASAPAQGAATRALASAVAPAGTVLVAEQAGQVVLLVAARPAPTDLVHDLRGRLRSSMKEPPTVGVAGPATGAPELATAFQDARRVISLLDALGRTGDIAHVGELGVYRFVFSASGRDDVRGFVRQCLGPLLDHDRDRGTRLVHTLSAYFAAGQRLAGAAQALHIHVNTLYQRLDRITALIGDRWKDPDRSFELHMALRLYALLSRTGTEPSYVAEGGSAATSG